MKPAIPDWNPETYARFRGLRLRPALDLLAQVASVPDGAIYDLGCGNGAAGEALTTRYPRRVEGVDASPSMLAKAGETGCYAALHEADISDWSVKDASMIFSNAALQWLPDHAHLLPRLAAMLAPGGVMAVQMPRNHMAPSHRFLRDIAAAMFPDRFNFASYEASVATAAGYWQLLAPMGTVHAWETEYIQHLAPTPIGHPVRAFTESTAMRPFVEKLTTDEELAFSAAYDAALGAAYPLLPDGAALFPFRRVFFTLKV